MRPGAPDAGAVVAGLPADLEVAVVRDGNRTVVAAGAEARIATHGTVAIDEIDRIRHGWWAGFCAYDLGRAVERVEPRHPNGAGPDLGLPDVALVRFGARVVLAPGAEPQLLGTGPGREVLAHALDTVGIDTNFASQASELRRWATSLDQPGYERAVGAIVAMIEAGDCYQVNLTRRLTCDQAADPVALFRALVSANPAPHAALLRLATPTGVVGVVSVSPERFLRRSGVDVETRPIKGTGTDAERLRRSEKDRAENVMIVDLARNDLGRVCVPGTITVPTLCASEAHPGLHHLVSTVRGRLRPGIGLGSLVRATFPPASVTGAPKPRVLQVIEDLEPVRRGIYCGAIGWVDADREVADLAVAIRTFVIAGGATHLGVGAGIVADSDPRAEWAETELKASRLLGVARGEPAGAPTPVGR